MEEWVDWIVEMFCLRVVLPIGSVLTVYGFLWYGILN